MSAEVDMTLHAPARLQIAAMLARADEVEFTTIREVTGVSDSVLSKHLTALSDAGYVKIVKAPRDGRQRTWASLTRKGRKAFATHMRALSAMVAAAEQAVATE